MNKRMIVFVLLLLFGVVFASQEQIVEAKTVKLSKKTITTTVDQKITIYLKNNKKKVSWSVSNKKILSITKKTKAKIVIKTKKSGTAKVQAKVGKKKYSCKVIVNAKDVTDNKTEETTENTTEEVKDEQPSDATKTVDAGEFSINSVHNGIATFYNRTSTGAANLDSYEVKYYTAAMYEDDYLKNMAGAYLEVTDKDGDKVKVMITDILPHAEGSSGNLDLSEKAFASIEPKVTGRMQISWKIIPLPTAEPISYKFKPTSSQWWAEVQVRNHRYPIKSLEYKNASGVYVALERKSYNYFAAPSGMGAGPYTFRVTDIYGHELIDTGIVLDTTEKEIAGKANFPY